MLHDMNFNQDTKSIDSTKRCEYIFEKKKIVRQCDEPNLLLAFSFSHGIFVLRWAMLKGTWLWYILISGKITRRKKTTWTIFNRWMYHKAESKFDTLAVRIGTLYEPAAASFSFLHAKVWKSRNNIPLYCLAPLCLILRVCNNESTVDWCTSHRNNQIALLKCQICFVFYFY